jgi:hypothetical protein
MLTTIVPAPNAAVLAAALQLEVTTGSPPERAWVLAYAAPRVW